MNFNCGNCAVREQNHLPLYDPADQELIFAVGECKSCDAEKNQPESPCYNKETVKKSFVVGLFNKMQPNEDIRPMRELTGIISMVKEELVKEINNLGKT